MGGNIYYNLAQLNLIKCLTAVNIFLFILYISFLQLTLFAWPAPEPSEEWLKEIRENKARKRQVLIQLAQRL